MEGADPRRESFDLAVARPAAGQHGVFSREQVRALGATRRMTAHRVDRGRWEPVHPNVWRLAGAPETWHQATMAAALAWGPQVAISHRCAAALWEFPGLTGSPPELIVPRARSRAGPGRVHRTPLASVDVTRRFGIPVTTPTRTLIDLAGVADLGLVEEALDHALLRGLTSVRRMRWRIEELTARGRPGIPVIRDLVETRASMRRVPESVFETRFLRRLRVAGIPLPVTQYEVRDPKGRLIGRVDFAYPDLRFGIETDGRGSHTGRMPFERDGARLTNLTLAGWNIIHVMWEHLRDQPNHVVESVRAGLALARTASARNR